MTFRQLIPPRRFAGWWTVHARREGERQNPWDWHTYFRWSFLHQCKCFPQTERKNHYDYYYYFICHYNLKLLTYFIRQIVFFPIFSTKIDFTSSQMQFPMTMNAIVVLSHSYLPHIHSTLVSFEKWEALHLLAKKSLEFRAIFVHGKFN